MKSGNCTVGSTILNLVTLFLISSIFAEAKKHERNQQVYCGACLAMIDELNWNIATISPKKKIQVGSFRVDSNGNQGLHQVPLARSEVQLYEFIEGLCLQMQHYAESKGTDGRISYIRTTARDGGKVSLRNIKISDRKQQSLRYACDTIIEESEDELITLLRSTTNDDGDEVTTSFCVETLGVCTKEELRSSREAKVQSVIDGKNEEEEERLRKIAEEEEDEEEEEERKDGGQESAESFEEAENNSDSDHSDKDEL